MNKDHIKFRLAKQKDVPQLVEINIDGDEKYRLINQTMFHELIQQNRVVIGHQNEDILGLIYWRDEFLGRFKQWYLKQITVRSDARRKGIGLQLLQYFLKFAREQGAEKVFADIHNDNSPSLKMALNAGGLISGTIEGVGNSTEKDERVIIRFEL